MQILPDLQCSLVYIRYLFFGYKIAVQIECLQIFHLPQNIGTLQLSLHISKKLNGITPQFEEFR